MRFVRSQAPGAGLSRLRWVAAPSAGLLGLTMLSGCTSHTSAVGTPPSSAVGRPAPSKSASHAPGSAPATTAPGGDTGAASSGWTIYHNQRYGFSAQIPASLTAGPSPNGGEGSTYRSADGHTEETVSASATPRGATASSEAADHATELRRRGALSYTNVDVTAQAFTVSGYLYGGAYIEYVRGVVGPHTEYLLTWSYPTPARSTVDPWVQHSAQTFQPGPL